MIFLEGHSQGAMIGLIALQSNRNAQYVEKVCLPAAFIVENLYFFSFTHWLQQFIYRILEHHLLKF